MPFPSGPVNVTTVELTAPQLESLSKLLYLALRLDIYRERGSLLIGSEGAHLCEIRVLDCPRQVGQPVVVLSLFDSHERVRVVVVVPADDDAPDASETEAVGAATDRCGCDVPTDADDCGADELRSILGLEVPQEVDPQRCPCPRCQDAE